MIVIVMRTSKVEMRIEIIRMIMKLEMLIAKALELLAFVIVMWEMIRRIIETVIARTIMISKTVVIVRSNGNKRNMSNNHELT